MFGKQSQIEVCFKRPEVIRRRNSGEFGLVHKNIPPKTTEQVSAELGGIVRQIVTSTTFLPTLSTSCTFDLLVYTDKNTDIPDGWGETGPRHDNRTAGTVRHVLGRPNSKPSKILDFYNLAFRFTAVRLDTPIWRPYAVAFVADRVVAVEVQYLRRVRRSPEHFGLLATTIFATNVDIKEGQLVIVFLFHRKLRVREDAVETFFER
ncbi:MAD2 mitotic arrest deficient-like 1 [Sparganum proliferum]